MAVVMRVVEYLVRQLYRLKRGEGMEGTQDVAASIMSEAAAAAGLQMDAEGVQDAMWAVGWAVLLGALGLLLFRFLKPSALPRTVRIKELIVYPIKSCKGIRLDSVKLAKTGLLHDRLFMLANASDGKFVSQRKYPRMSLIETKMDAAAGTLTIDAPGMETRTFPLAQPTDKGSRRPVSVWGDACVGYDMGDELAKWFNTFLQLDRDFFKGYPLRFVRLSEDEEDTRPTDPKFEPGQTGFADGFPFLLAATESVAYINTKLEEGGQGAITMDHFRPNVVVDGAGAWAEDAWVGRRIRIAAGTGAVAGSACEEFAVVKPCARCTMPNITPATGEFLPGSEPSKTMKAFRSGRALEMPRSKDAGQIFFGQNLVHCGREGGVLSVGDVVTVTDGARKE